MRHVCECAELPIPCCFAHPGRLLRIWLPKLSTRTPFCAGIRARNAATGLSRRQLRRRLKAIAVNLTLQSRLAKAEPMHAVQTVAALASAEHLLDTSTHALHLSIVRLQKRNGVRLPEVPFSRLTVNRHVSPSRILGGMPSTTGPS